jgi:hypothetical protein
MTADEEGADGQRNEVAEDRALKVSWPNPMADLQAELFGTPPARVVYNSGDDQIRKTRRW